jgi:hypothetical protein
VASPHPARADFPVGYAMVGCIKDGKFRLQGASGPAMDDPAVKALEGKTVRVEGYLSPGDRFHANAVLVVDDQCRDDLHKSYLLCDPCQTLPAWRRRAPRRGEKTRRRCNCRRRRSSSSTSCRWRCEAVDDDQPRASRWPKPPPRRGQK